jgi:hypothetical protein
MIIGGMDRVGGDEVRWMVMGLSPSAEMLAVRVAVRELGVGDVVAAVVAAAVVVGMIVGIVGIAGIELAFLMASRDLAGCIVGWQLVVGAVGVVAGIEVVVPFAGTADSDSLQKDSGGNSIGRTVAVDLAVAAVFPGDDEDLSWIDHGESLPSYEETGCYAERGQGYEIVAFAA